MNRVYPAYAVVGLGFGDEGKGAIVDFLARKARESASGKGRGGPGLVVRFNGGPQAAHRVVSANGQSHIFSNFGAGTLAGYQSYCGPEMCVEPGAILLESQALKKIDVRDSLAALTLDRDCVVVTPFHRLMGQIQEVRRGDERHGSCGRGVGQALLDGENSALPTLRVGELFEANELKKKLRFLQLVKIDQAEQLIKTRVFSKTRTTRLRDLLKELKRPDQADLLADFYFGFVKNSGVRVNQEPPENFLSAAHKQGPLIFEGAQGALLDRHYGFFPHVTASDTSLKPALELWEKTEIGRSDPECLLRLGALRAYTTRHGAGPFVSEDIALKTILPESHNFSDEWQGDFRVGPMDLPALRYALSFIGDLDGLALTCLDRLEQAPAWGRWIERYQTPPGADVASFFESGSVPGQITGIKKIDPEDFVRRRRLTEILFNCLPVFCNGDTEKQESAGLETVLRERTGVAVLIRSRGPGAGQKEFLESRAMTEKSIT